MRMRFKDALCVISIGRILLAAAASGAVLATNAFAQSAREVRDASNDTFAKSAGLAGDFGVRFLT
jgi:hypothetical protein